MAMLWCTVADGIRRKSGTSTLTVSLVHALYRTGTGDNVLTPFGMQLKVSLLQFHLSLGQGVLERPKLTFSLAEPHHHAFTLLLGNCILLVQIL